MSVVYADTSALSSMYLADEADGAWMRQLVLQGGDEVVTTELARVELASSLARAQRDGRLDGAAVSGSLQAFALHTANDGPIGVAPLSEETLLMAQDFVLRVNVRTLDALHLAAARRLAQATGEEVQILTRDRRQAQAAAALGLPLHPRSAR